MKFLQPTLKKHLACGTYAVALVCSLVLYQKTVITNPLSVTQRHARTNASRKPSTSAAAQPRLVTHSPYEREKAILMQFYGALDDIYHRKSSTQPGSNSSGSTQFKPSRS